MRTRAAFAAALAVASFLPRPAAARQAAPATPPPVRLVAFTNEPREPEIGEVFALNVTLRIAPGVVAFLPDTLLPARDAVSAGSGRWELGIAPGDSVDVRATYPVLGLDPGGAQLPSLEVWTRPVAPGEQPGPRALASLAGRPGAASPAGEPPAPGLERTVIPTGGVLIMPLRAMIEADDGGLRPRPPADVVGGLWSAWLAGAVALLLAGAAALLWLLRGRGSSGLILGPPPRKEALSELDRIRTLGWHTNGRVVEFYDATTGVLRRFADLTEAECGRYLTSTELLGRLEELWGSGRVTELRHAVGSAERVKFGFDRPEAEAAESDWATVRAWIEGLPEGR